MDESFFYVSNFRKEIKVPIKAAMSVDQALFMKISKPAPIMIKFNSPNKIGEKILFIPNEKAFESKDFIQELNNIIFENQKTCPGSMSGVKA
ncbi:MAG: hypothetical protein PF482_02940 [Desulfobacteraceae bacterium]|nr:hypothetical protein [Desulfobacteraceae bacterium]